MMIKKGGSSLVGSFFFYFVNDLYVSSSRSLKQMSYLNLCLPCQWTLTGLMKGWNLSFPLLPVDIKQGHFVKWKTIGIQSRQGYNFELNS